MLWQDFVFMIGSSLSIFFLAPTLRDSAAQVPLGTSVPSVLIGAVYGVTFLTMGMTFSAFGAFAAGWMWSLIAVFRSPTGRRHLEGWRLFVADCHHWSRRLRGSTDHTQQFLLEERHPSAASTSATHENQAGQSTP